MQDGPSKAVSDGFYIITKPLAKGTYPIHFKSSLLCTEPGCSEPNFAQDITYTIIIVQYIESKLLWLQPIMIFFFFLP
jgi:hypothetical protein